MNLDTTLAWQLTLAWAGEKDRLGWWKTAALDEFAGLDVLKGQLGLSKPAWSAMRALLHAARARDAQIRAGHPTPSQITTLFHWGPKLDEQLEDRFAELRALHDDPREAFPLLKELTGDGDWEESWDGPDALRQALQRHPTPKTRKSTLGLQLQDPSPDSLLTQLLGAQQAETAAPIPYAELLL